MQQQRPDDRLRPLSAAALCIMKEKLDVHEDIITWDVAMFSFRRSTVHLMDAREA